MKVSIEVFLKGEPAVYKEGMQWAATHYEAATAWGPTAASQIVTFEVPDDWDPRPGMVEALRAEKAELLAQAQLKASQIEERINSLLAIECKVEA